MIRRGLVRGRKGAVRGPERVRVVGLFGGAPLVSGHGCCECVSTSSSPSTPGARVAVGDPHPRSLVRRCLDVARWIIPSGILALLPKCPACLATYFPIGTAIAISVPTPLYLPMPLVTLR